MLDCSYICIVAPYIMKCLHDSEQFNVRFDSDLSHQRGDLVMPQLGVS